MNTAQSLILQTDREYLASVAKGQPELPPGVTDKAKYLEGLVQRQNVGKSWAAADSLASIAIYLAYGLDGLIRNSLMFFSYDRAQQNLEFLFVLQSLDLDLRHWNQARKAAVAKGCYDCYDPCCSEPERPDRWAIWQVNEISADLAKAIDLMQTLQAVPPAAPPNAPVDLIATIGEVLPLFQAFQAFFPEFCAVLDREGYLDLTGQSEPKFDRLPELEITLPNSIAKALLPLAKVLGKDADVLAHVAPRIRVDRAASLPVDKAASDFQGFFMGIVMEPGDPDHRDLHGNWTSKEDCELGCDRWALRHGVVGVGHTEIPDEQGTRHPHFVLLRNWIQIGDTTIGGQLVKDGTWLQAYQAVSEWAKQAVANFEINGLSPGGTARFIEDRAA